MFRPSAGGWTSRAGADSLAPHTAQEKTSVPATCVSSPASFGADEAPPRHGHTSAATDPIANRHLKDYTALRFFHSL